MPGAGLLPVDQHSHQGVVRREQRDKRGVLEWGKRNVAVPAKGFQQLRVVRLGIGKDDGEILQQHVSHLRAAFMASFPFAQLPVPGSDHLLHLMTLEGVPALLQGGVPVEHILEGAENPSALGKSLFQLGCAVTGGKANHQVKSVRAAPSGKFDRTVHAGGILLESDNSLGEVQDRDFVLVLHRVDDLFNQFPCQRRDLIRGIHTPIVGSFRNLDNQPESNDYTNGTYCKILPL